MKEKETMEVEIISSEFIKPSFPTSDYQKIYKISLLDQFVSPIVYVPMLFFYSAKSETVCYDQTQVVKKSLSQALALYYPLAGKMKDTLSIDCNDDGAYFVSARVQLDLSDYLQDPNHSFFPKLMPKENVFGVVKLEDPLVMVQQTRFSCGGIAIGICISHVICDAISASAFIKAWAAIARGSSDALLPDFTAPTLFLQDEGFLQDLKVGNLTNFVAKNRKSVARRFVFDGSVMSTLKSITKSSSVPNPTRVECVSAVLFRSIRLATKENSTPLVTNSVNLRRRAVPSFAESSVGNFVWLINVPFEHSETDLSGFVIRMREAVSAVNDDLVKSLQGEKGKERMAMDLEKVHKSFANGTDRIVVGSWCNIGLNKSADFGWGKPLWIPYIGMSVLPQCSVIMLMDAEDGNGGGIEAWLGVDEDIMSIVEKDMELLSFAKLNPSPLQERVTS